MHQSWEALFEKHKITDLVESIYKTEQKIFPPKEQVFKVFDMDVNEIKILLLGQDPYHGIGQANGLSFSVPKGVSIPPSLRNIYKELNGEFPDRNYKFTHGDLSLWFLREKIFLLNSSLTVIESQAGSMMSLWEKFTNDVINYVSIQNPNCVFVLLGNFSKNKSKFIVNPDKIITGVHPSPLSASKGFFDSGIFIKIEEKLGSPVDWSV
jgi:uracil-DNA glycosylase